MPRNYNFVSLPQQKPDRVNVLGKEGKDKFGHNKYQLNTQRFSGKLFLDLTIEHGIPKKIKYIKHK